LLILLAGILIHGFWKDELYFDTVHWEITEKNSADETAERLRKYSNDNYNISWRDRQ
jgi:galactose-1-phosphate uridylyltransferase